MYLVLNKMQSVFAAAKRARAGCGFACAARTERIYSSQRPSIFCAETGQVGFVWCVAVFGS